MPSVYPISCVYLWASNLSSQIFWAKLPPLWSHTTQWQLIEYDIVAQSLSLFAMVLKLSLRNRSWLAADMRDNAVSIVSCLKTNKQYCNIPFNVCGNVEMQCLIAC